MKNPEHEKLINLIEERVKKNHLDAIAIKGKEYFSKKTLKIAGEIDLFCIFNKNFKEIIYVFEIKSVESSKYNKKAIKQLKSHKKDYFNQYFKNIKIHYFYVVGKNCENDKNEYVIQKKQL